MKRGMTLIEVLVSVALLLLLSGVVFAFLRDVTTSRDRIAELTAKQRVASTIIQHIERQLPFAIVGDSVFGCGVDGDETSLTILHRGVAVSEATHADTWSRAFYDLIQTEFRFDESSHRIELRSSVPKHQSAAENSDGRGAGSNHGAELPFEQLRARVYKLRFRYHDGTNWRSTFDSLDSQQLPRAIEIAIWFNPWPGSDWNNGDSEWPDGQDEGSLPERLTFEMQDVFDELEFATRADRDFRPEPVPDRIRVIAIPDADEDSFESTEED